MSELSNHPGVTGAAVKRSLAVLRGRRAFTLIELLVSLGLMSIMLTMMAVIFASAQGAFKQGRAAVEIHQTARAILDVMRYDFSGARVVKYWPTTGTTADHVPSWGRFAGSDRTHLSGSPTDYEHNTGDIIEFTTTADQTAAVSGTVEIAGGRLCIVRYFLVNDTAGTSELRKLVRVVDDNEDLEADLSYDATSAATIAATGGEPLGLNVVSMDFRYYRPIQGDTGRPAWTENAGSASPDETGDWPPTGAPWPPRVPACVEVTLVVTDYKRTVAVATGAMRTYTFKERFYLAAWNAEE